MSSGSTLKSLAMGVLGLLLGTIGIDPMTGFFRFNYGLVELGDGIGVVPVAVGLFGLSEILLTAGQATAPEVIEPRLKELFPSREEWRHSLWPIGRGTVLGFLIGIIPGSAHIISSFVSYAVERRLSKHPERFGQGAIEGVAVRNRPTTRRPRRLCSHARVGRSIRTYPRRDDRRHDGAWNRAWAAADFAKAGTLLGLLASMYVGNVVLLILNLPLVGIFVNLLRIPYPLLYPAIHFLRSRRLRGQRQRFDVGIMTVMGALGFGLRKFHFEAAPVVLGLVLAPMMEMSFRQSLAMSSGSYSIFLTRPIALVLLMAGLALLLLSVISVFTKKVAWRDKIVFVPAQDEKKPLSDSFTGGENERITRLRYSKAAPPRFHMDFNICGLAGFSSRSVCQIIRTREFSEPRDYHCRSVSPRRRGRLTARPVAAAMEKVLKNPVVVANKTGAAGAVGMSFVANSKPDGYNLLMALSSISIIPEADKLFDRKPAYTMDQLIPIALISADPTVFVVHADRPWKSVKEFIEDAKKRPGEISYSSSGVYGTLHMAMELLTYAAGISLKHVPYSGAGPPLPRSSAAMWTPWHRTGCGDPANQGRQTAAPGRLGRKKSSCLARSADVQGARLRYRILHLGRALRAAGDARPGDEKNPRNCKAGGERCRIQSRHGKT